MSMQDEVIIVFTAKSRETILAEGGTSAWRLDRNHARRCAYALCTRNAHADWTEGSEPHHAAFMIGKVKDVVAAPVRDGRFLVQFSEYALLNKPNAWQGDRNPVSYDTVKHLKNDIGIDPDTLDWQPMPEPTPMGHIVAGIATRLEDEDRVGPLTMAQAKQGLALTFGVSPDAIEITVRG